MVINYIKRNKYLFIFLCGLLFISFISGIIIYLNIDNNVKLDLFNNVFNIKESLINNRINNIFNHLFVVILIVLLSFSCLGYFLGLFYLFYEGMSISFTFMFLCQIKGLKGLIFILLYDLLFKIVYLILIFMLLIKLFYIFRTIIRYFIYKSNIYIKNTLISVFIIVLLIVINDILIYFLSNFFIKLLINML